MYNNGIDDKWNAYWQEHKVLFDEKSNKPIFSIDTPPPFTTGELHMGQAFWVCYIDSIARYKRLRGFNVLYPQGWDMQGFPIEIAVEKKFGRSLSRADFYGKCTALAEENIGKMKVQMRNLGASFDESLEYKTASKDYRRKLQLSLLMMYEKGMIYRAKHPIEWCPHCESSISREQVNEISEKSNLNYIDFGIEGSKDKMTIATTRPEMLHAIVAVAVNPADKRYKKLIGKSVKVPVFNNSVKIIGEDSIDMEYGTGAEMICTFGDKNDVLLSFKHKLGFVEAIDEKGLLKNAGKFNGMHTTKARDAVLEDLKTCGALIKQEPIEHAVKQHDRCHTAIELIVAMQWFIKTKEFSNNIKESALSMKWFPDASKQRLLDWSNVIEWDWNISRHRVFGTPIPFWYCENCNEIVAPKKEALPVDPASTPAPKDKCPKCGSRLIGESDTCDCWIDSSITPMIIAGWPENKALFARAFPSSMRIQGMDIIRTWAFYTTFRMWALTGNKPFEHLLTHGMILDTEGKEMHKSSGNGISPELLVNKKYPIDAIRLWVALCGGIGKDKSFSYAEIDYAKSFLIKLENTAIFVKSAIDGMRLEKEPPHKYFGIFDLWILDRLNTAVKEVMESYDNLDLYEAMSKAMAFHWHEFADFYIENVKYRIHSTEKGMEGSKRAAAFTLLHVFRTSLLMLAPVMPHIAEELNAMFESNDIFANEFPQHMARTHNSDYIINGVVFKSAIQDIAFDTAGTFLNGIITEVRKAKAKGRMALNKEISSIIINVPEEYYMTTIAAKDELMQICKAKDVQVSKGEYSVEIKI